MEKGGERESEYKGEQGREKGEPTDMTHRMLWKDLEVVWVVVVCCIVCANEVTSHVYLEN